MFSVFRRSALCGKRLPSHLTLHPRRNEYLPVDQKELWETIRLSVCYTEYMGLSPRFAPAALEGVTAHGESPPLQRSACDNAEVSLFPVSVFASPGWQTRFRLIRLIALFHSFKEKKVIAGSKSPWLGILTPIQVTYLMV